MPVEQEVFDYAYADSRVTIQPSKNNTLLATNLGWQSDRQYYEGDIVYRNNRMYIAKNNNIDKRPDITTNWTLSFVEPFKPTGMIPSNNSGDTNNDIDMSAGRCWDSTGLIPIIGTALTKRLDAAISLGTNAGGLFSGNKANSTLYYIFVIVRDNDGTINYGFSTSLIAADRPAGWTTYALRGAVWTDGSGNIRNGSFALENNQMVFKYNSFVVDRNVTALAGTNRELLTGTVPPNCVGLFSMLIVGSAASQYINIGEIHETDAAPSGYNDSKFRADSGDGLVYLYRELRVDANRQFFIRSNSGSGTSIGFKTEGYKIDL
jgi:hypothetical protein